MKMTNDPQHLITVSLGKIAMARTQRGGVNLHKNLLVASVLHRARSRYVMESYIPLVSSKKKRVEDAEIEENCDNSAVIVAPYNSLTSMDSDHDDGTQTDVAVNGIDKENDPPSWESRVENDLTDDDGAGHAKATIQVQEEIRDRLGISTLDQTNSEPSAASEQKNYIELSPVKTALKRRLSRQASIPSPQPMKRVRHSSHCEVYYDNSSSAPEPMQTEQQITSLVTIFNTGFNGLCSSRSDSVISCATQLVDHHGSTPFDLSLPMVAPPIALSV